MRVWFDTEFIEDGRTIDLLSIGMVREDGRLFYAVSSDADQSRAGPWVKENVLPYLHSDIGLLPTSPWHGTWSRGEIAHKIEQFVGLEGNVNPKFWAWFGSYDWVALCQLYGAMMDIPEHWPMRVCDVAQLAEGYKIDTPKENEHNALADALWARDAWREVMLRRAA